MHATVTGEGWAVTARGTTFSAPGVPIITSLLAIDLCLRRNEGDSILSVSPPPLTPAVAPVPPGGRAHSVGHSGMSQELGEAGSAHGSGGGMERRGYTQTGRQEGADRDGTGLGGWGQGLGVSWGPRQPARPGIRED